MNENPVRKSSRRKKLKFENFVKEMHQEISKNTEDTRQSGKVEYSLLDVIMSAFGCMYFQDKSFLQFQRRLQDEQNRNNLETLFGVKGIPKDSQMRTLLNNVSPDILQPIYPRFVSLFSEAGELKKFEIFPGYYYVAIDGTQYFCSKNISCSCCLHKKLKNEEILYYHQALQAVILHPEQKTILPILTESIKNEDGQEKQDCEMNAAKRLLKELKERYPNYKFIVGGDGLYAKQPLIVLTRELGFNYILVAKPDDHQKMYEYISDNSHRVTRKEVIEAKGERHIYEYLNKVPLNGNEETIEVNYISYKVISKNGEVLYSNSWVTDFKINSENMKLLVKAGKSRWKIENECFNNLKNHGYNLEHNYGHGVSISFNMYLLMLFAFLVHQILTMCDEAYQENRMKWGSNSHLWERLRSFAAIIVFDSWESLLAFNLNPKKFKIVPI